MTFNSRKILLFNSIALLILFSWSILVPTAQGANPATIKRALWRIDDAKLVIKGKLASPGSTITVTTAGSGDLLGAVQAEDDGLWRFGTCQ
jgi:hypothetical protein